MEINKEVKNINTAVYVATGSAIYTLILAIINPTIPNYILDTKSMILEAIIILLLSLGVYKKSRICAILLFGLYLLEFILNVADDEPGGIMLVISYFTLRGMISIFKYHKIKSESEKVIIAETIAESEIGDSPIQYAQDNKTPNGQNYIYIKPGLIVTTIIVIVSVIVVIASLGSSYTSVEEDSPISFRQEIDEIVDLANTELPIMIDDDTRFDSILLDSANSIMFSYTIVTCLKEDIDIDIFEKLMKPIVVQSVIESEEFEDLKHNNYTFKFSYYDKNNVKLVDIIVKPKDYNKYI